MIKITDGNVIYEVTTGAYNTVYKKMGFYPFDGTAEKTDAVDEGDAASEVAVDAEEQADEAADVEENDGADDSASSDDEFCSELEKKPISQWNKTEVKQYASIKGIDISGTKSINEARDRIKAAQESW